MYPTSSYSGAYTELTNLLNVALYHKAHCTDADCGVTLFSLRKTGRRLVNYVWPQERKAAIEIWEQFPLT